MKHIVFFLFFFLVQRLAAQEPVHDTTAAPRQQRAIKKTVLPATKKDTAISRRLNPDSSISGMDAANGLAAARPESPFTASKARLSYNDVLRINPWFNFFAPAQSLFSEERTAHGKDALFYLLTGLLFFFALIKLLFNRYVNNLLGLVFRGSLRQKQIREQLLQTPLPSLFLNIFFVIVAGLYIFFLLRHYRTVQVAGFWLLLFYCVLAIALVYLVKFLMLKFTGWIFNMREAADTYIFIVFLVNKLLAIFLLPLLIIMAFSMDSWTNVLLTLSYLMVGGFFAYRYIVSFAPVRREVKVSQFHFFMYLCAFEIIPLLLIYKVLLRFF